VTINAQDNLTFDKPSVTISPTERVCWQNFGTVTHTVTSDPSTPPDATWNLNSTLTSNTVVIKSFAVVGDYPYHCVFHAGMQGAIHVR
jgi:plastocyanin